MQDAIGGAAERAYEAITTPDGAVLIPSSQYLHHDGSGDQIAGEAASPHAFDIKIDDLRVSLFHQNLRKRFGRTDQLLIKR